jgi:hypothetical protein
MPEPDSCWLIIGGDKAGRIPVPAFPVTLQKREGHGRVTDGTDTHSGYRVSSSYLLLMELEGVTGKFDAPV